MKGSLLRICGLSGAGLLVAAALRPLFAAGPSMGWSLAAIAGGLLLSVWLVGDWERIADGLDRPAARYELGSAVEILLVFALVVGLAVLAGRRDQSWDWTRDRRHSLAPETLEVLDRLQQPIEVLAYYTRNSDDRGRFEGLGQRYAAASPKMRFEFVDPERQPWRSEGDGVFADETVILRSAQREERRIRPDEEELTNAVLQVTRSGTKRLLFSVGHGEHELDSDTSAGYGQAAQALRAAGYSLDPVRLYEHEELPEDADLLVVAGPRRPLGPREVALVEGFIDSGGALFLLLEPGHESGLEPLLSRWGLSSTDAVVVDLLAAAARGVATDPITDRYAPHEITGAIKLATLFRGARPVHADPEPPLGVLAWDLVQTSSEAFAETSPGEPHFDAEADPTGPFSLLAAAELRVSPAVDPAVAQGGEAAERRWARVVVSGDSDFAANGSFRLLGNADLFLNSVAYLAQELDLLDVHRSEGTGGQLRMSGSQVTLFAVASGLGLPALLAAFALGLWWWRRRL
jgi:ABC-type uncharacterized transport system involved in gliding motility auxiliary subunit